MKASVKPYDFHGYFEKKKKKKKTNFLPPALIFTFIYKRYILCI